jgi:hypothetical protein
MAFEVMAGPGTERVRADVEEAVREGLGERTRSGDWRLQMNRVDGGYLVDLTNRDGFMQQWVFRPDEPIEYEIRESLRRAF